MIVKIQKIVGIIFEKLSVVLRYPLESTPKIIAKNKYISSSGSFIGVLNLTIDKAPTNPSDKANDDFTIKITKKTIKDKIGNIDPICNFPDKDFELFI